MHLKTLTLRGFKSFASATTLHFEPGITCVVGPNGSGKSNVVDALAWVMGEQGAKTLRGGAMADVIFAGTSGRPPLGRAEVSLTIDNSDGALPIEYSEVTISRTLFRQGSSEYAINGTPCRLLDIQELLSDSGLGKEMHVIVGQGRLDSVLSATPEERRGFIEEAAGILKHRRRKEKALRKLDSMAANLARLTDLTGEIRRQLGPLAKQADVARRASVIQSDLRDATARLLADDLVQLQATMARDLADDSAAREKAAQVEAQLVQVHNQIEALENQAAVIASEVTDITQMWYELSSLKERLRATATVASERHRHVHEVLTEPARPGRDPEELARGAANLRKAEAELAGELSQAKETLEAALAQRQEAEAQAAQAERALSLLHQGIADRREGVAKLSGRVAAAQSRLDATGAQVERVREQMVDAKERAEAAANARAEAEQALALFEADGAADGALDAAVADVELAKKKVATLEAQHRDLRERHASWQARCEALEMSVQTKDAMAQLRKVDQRIEASIAQLLSVPTEYAGAIALALGELADAALAPDLESAGQALSIARTQELGSARMVVGAATAVDLAALVAEYGPPPQPGVWALAVVDAAPALTGALAHLLDHVLIAPTDEQAQRLLSETGYTAISQQGALFSPSHVIGGSAVEQNLVHLHAALTQARHEVDDARTGLDELAKQLEAAKEKVQLHQEQLAALERDRKAAEAKLVKLQQDYGQHTATYTAGQAEYERAQVEENRLLEALAQYETELTALREQLVVAELEPQDAQADLATASAKRDEAAEIATQARSAETDARLVLRTLEERIRALGGRAESMERAAATERRAQEVAKQRAQALAKQAAIAAFVRDSATNVLVQLDQSLAIATQAREDAQERKAKVDAELARTRKSLSELQDEQRKLSDVLHQDDLARAQHQLRIEQLQERAVAELAIEPDVLIDEFGPHQPIPVGLDDDGEQTYQPYVRTEQERRLKAANRGLTLLGKVNPLALEEHAALEERHKFLSEQLADLKRSRSDLLKIVQEIDERVEAVFTEAFADTAEQFEKVFDVLFPGGEGKLLLTDPEDLLTTGIEIEARPAGKKVKRLSLLSGGERSLTAIALLVAIFKARPSPFYVMDEVEAALDDVNLGRLLTIMSELRKDSQLIVITHQKRTMEIADALYGVTMRGDGVTTVISQRINEE